jgi:hypothetical protein
MVRGRCSRDGKDSYSFVCSRGSNRRSLALSGNVSRQRDRDLHVNEHTAVVGHRALRFGFSVACLSGPGLLCRHRGAVARELALGLSFAATRCRKLGGLLPPSPPAEKATARKPATIARIMEWPSLLLSCFGIASRGGEMTDWVPVLIVALIVVCATAYLGEASRPSARNP